MAQLPVMKAPLYTPSLEKVANGNYLFMFCNFLKTMRLVFLWCLLLYLRAAIHSLFPNLYSVLFIFDTLCLSMTGGIHTYITALLKW